MGRIMTEMLSCEQNVCRPGITARMDDVLVASSLLLKRFLDMFQRTWCTTWQNLTTFGWVDHRERDRESGVAVVFC
jgi:hypothetical protein